MEKTLKFFILRMCLNFLKSEKSTTIFSRMENGMYMDMTSMMKKSLLN